MSTILPIPKIALHIRPGTMEDIPFLDSLQKMHTKQVGWMPTKQFEGKIKLGHVLVAEEVATNEELGVGSGEAGEETPDSIPLTPHSQLRAPVGYCIGNDQYFKRDDVGIIYQMNVVPGKQRGLIGATLLKAMFDRAAYGCRLFCCWCAQDIEANRFWEAMGFVPLAFRAGSREKGRVHIFWQRRIRAGDDTTPWWFPSQTTSGAIREDRLVLPIPPGTHWSDVMPVILPGALPGGQLGALPGVELEAELTKPQLTTHKPIRNPKSKIQNKPIAKCAIASGALRFAVPETAVGNECKRESKKREPKQCEPKQKTKNDPKLIAAARELRDRWLERVNAEASALSSQGKYDVSRQIGSDVNDGLIDALHFDTPRLLTAA